MFSVQLNMKNRVCLFIGGGNIAERRIQHLLDEGANIQVISPRITDKIAQWYEEGKLQWTNDIYREGALPEAFMVFLMTPDEAVNERCAAEARRKGALVNRADIQDECDYIIPAQIEIGELSATLSTNRISPRMSRLLRQDFEERYAPLRMIWDELKEMRDEVKALLPTSKERESFWRENLKEEEFTLILQNQWSTVEEKLRNAIRSVGAKS